MAVWNDMLAEIASRLVLHLNQRFLEHRPAEDVDSHGRQVASGNGRLLLKFHDTIGLVRNQDTETAGFLNRYRHCSNGDICVVSFVIIQHNLIVHLVNVIAG